LRQSTAEKLIRKCVDEYIKKRLAFDANLFEKGMSYTPHSEKCFKEKQRIEQAWETLTEKAKAR